MKITYIAWNRVIPGDVKRLLYGTIPSEQEKKENKASGKKRPSGDHAIQKFNSFDENPGLWRGFTNNLPIPTTVDGGVENIFPIYLENSVNPIALWQSISDGRTDPIKISQGIYLTDSEHRKQIIEIWYLGYMRILQELTKKMIERGNEADIVDAKKIYQFTTDRLNLTKQICDNILAWVHETQEGFKNIEINYNIFKDENIKDIKKFVDDNYFLVIKIRENDVEKNYALMANRSSVFLHPWIKKLLQSNKREDLRNGKYVDIDITMTSPNIEINEYLELLSKHKNIILYGPPGTGKTRILMELEKAFNNTVTMLFDPMDTEAPFKVISTETAGSSQWCTFHPNYTYENFVHGLEPVVKGKVLGYKPHVGPFLEQLHEANTGKKALLVIDEINRAKTDDVFGDTIALIRKGSEEKLVLPQSVKINGEEVSELKSSDNLYIIGTMNSLDKSTSPLSAELKKRFKIIEVKPDLEALRVNLMRNETIDSDLCNFCCDLMEILNNRIHEYCGKEYELGQGYFWPLVEATSNHEEVLADILKYKILPHLYDVLPTEYLAEFFLYENQNVLYSVSAYGTDFAEVSRLSASELLNSFAVLIESEYKCKVMEQSGINEQTFENYQKEKIESIRNRLQQYKNIILTGVSGTGKTYLANEIAKEYPNCHKMFWHNSTEYADVIEGISAKYDETGDGIEFSISPGMIKQLATAKNDADKLMIIEGFNKSNAAENLGELITLLEPDKRKLSIKGLDGDIRIPENMYFICTMNPNVEKQYKLDSALKRRFLTIHLEPDYQLLALRLGIANYKEPLKNIPIDDFTDEDIKCLAVQLLENVNKNILQYIGAEYQLGHDVFWDLNERKESLWYDFVNAIDERIIPHLEEYCYDKEIAFRIFGLESPLLALYQHGLEIIRMKDLSDNKHSEALKGLLHNE